MSPAHAVNPFLPSLQGRTTRTRRMIFYNRLTKASVKLGDPSHYRSTVEDGEYNLQDGFPPYGGVVFVQNTFSFSSSCQL